MNQKKKILIYDNNQFFLKYFKKNFEAFEFKSFSEDDLDEDLTNCFMVIFIMENASEFIEFLKIYDKDVKIIFGCFDKSFYVRRNEMAQLNGVKVIDISGTKMDIKDQVEHQLQMLN